MLDDIFLMKYIIINTITICHCSLLFMWLRMKTQKKGWLAYG